MLLAVAAACGSETIEVPGETVVVEKVVTETVEVPGETVVVEKEVIKTVEVPGETVTKEVVKEVMVPGETVVVEKEVVKTVEVPGQTVVVEVVKTVEVPGQTVVVEKEVVKTVEVPGQTVVVEKRGGGPGGEVEVVREVPGKNYVTDPVFGTVVPAPEYGGTFTIGARSFPTFRDHYSNWAFEYQGTVNEKLGHVDWAIDRDTYAFVGAYPAPLYTLKGALAESWATPDDKTIVVKVRQGVYFHDKPPVNGREMTAEDVEYNFHRMLGLGKFTEAGPNPHGSVRALNSIPWESVTATDKWTVVFKLKEPSVKALVNILDSHNAVIQGPEVIEESRTAEAPAGNIEDWRNMVGTGPFMLTDVVEGTSYSYTKNPDYWGYDEKYPENRLPYIDELRFLLMPDESTRLAGLRSAKIDFIGEQGGGLLRSVDQVDSLKRTDPELVIHMGFLRGDTGALLNVSKPPYDDIRVRKAMQMAINLEEINDTYYKGYLSYADLIPRGLVGRGMKGYHGPFEEWPEELQQEYTYNPEEAERLLDEAGYPRGADGIRFKTTSLAFPGHDLSLVELQASYWREIGVDVDIDVVSSGAEFFARHKAGDFDMSVLNNGTEADPTTAVSRYWSGHPWNVARVIFDAQYDAMYDALIAAATVEEEMRVTKQMDMHAIEHFWMLWAAPMTPWFTVTQPWVIGYNGEGPFGGGQVNVVLSRLWIDSELKEAMGH